MRERPSLHLKGRPSRASFVLCPLTPRCIGALTLLPTTGTKVGVQRVPPPVRRRQLFLPAAISALKSN